MIDLKYKGMTVNERLYISGLMDTFDKAVQEENVEEVVQILKEVEITDKSAIKEILKELALPKKL
jgi:hypothetical protein